MNRIEQIGKIIAILAALFAVCQYYIEIQNKKKNKSYSYFEKYTTGEILEHKDIVNWMIYDLYEEYNNGNVTVEVLKTSIVNKFREENSRNSYRIVLEFFDAVFKCDKIKVCHRKTTTDLFQTEAKRILNITFPAVEHFREEGITDGHGLRCIAKGHKTEGCLD